MAVGTTQGQRSTKPGANPPASPSTDPQSSLPAPAGGTTLRPIRPLHPPTMHSRSPRQAHCAQIAGTACQFGESADDLDRRQIKKAPPGRQHALDVVGAVGPSKNVRGAIRSTPRRLGNCPHLTNLVEPFTSRPTVVANVENCLSSASVLIAGVPMSDPTTANPLLALLARPGSAAWTLSARRNSRRPPARPRSCVANSGQEPFPPAFTSAVKEGGHQMLRTSGNAVGP